MASDELPVVRMEFFGDPADGSVKFRVGDVSDALRKQGTPLRDGLQVVLTDGELSMNVLLVRKDDGWSIVVC